METPDRAFLTKSSRMIVGEIVNTLRAQANPSGTDDHISTDETSPVISGKYAIVPSISIGIMDYEEFFDVVGGFYEESGINNSGQHPWNTIGAVGLDAIFTPYTTESVLSKSPFLPRFTIPSGSEQVTSETLNPFNPFNSLSGISYSGNSVDDDPWFSGGHNISMALSYNPYDSGVDGSGGFVGISGIYPSGSGSPISYFFEEDHFARHTVETTSIRGVGLKSPMVLSGWGYDIGGNPVPGISGKMHPEASWNPSVWKSGPVDLRWSESRGVWVPPKICDEIFFKIASFDPVSMKALGELLGCDDGYELTEVQGQTSPGILIVEVFDYLGCIFDEPSSDLFDRVGIARWKRVKVNGVLQPSQWVVETLCCKSPKCEV